MVSVILMIAFAESMRTQLDIEIGLEHAKNINNLFAEKFDLRKVANIN